MAFWLAFLVYTVYTLSVALVPIRSDNDCWWHVKSGMYIARHGLPENDVLSYTSENYPWHNHEWLAQLALYGAYHLGDATGFGEWRGVILFKALIVWACYAVVFVLAGRLSRSAWIALLVAALAVAVGRRTFYPRPPVISNLILICEIALLTAVSEGWLRRAWAFVLVPVIALWTNLHGGWMAGGVVLAAFAADQVYTLVRGRLPRLPFEASPNVMPFKFMAILLPLCLLATLLNPYGWELYKLPARVMQDQQLVMSIGELQPPNFYFVIDFELVIHGALILALFLTRFRPRLFDLLIYLFFLHQAIQHVRHLLLFSVMMVPLYSRLLGAAAIAARESLADWQPLQRFRQLYALPFFGAGVLGLSTMGWVIVNPREGGSISHLFDRDSNPSTYIQRNLAYYSGEGYVRSRFPAEISDFIELADLKGRMFNENHYAGYLIWRFSPEKYKVFSDPRFDIFGGDIWRQERAIVGAYDDPQPHPGPPTWQQLLDEWQVQWIINVPTTALTPRLYESTDWTLVAMTRDRWQVWIRQTRENRPMIEAARKVAAGMGLTPPP